jgi:photosystem II stability/assembly factor-like uncharacterized protein
MGIFPRRSSPLDAIFGETMQQYKRLALMFALVLGGAVASSAQIAWTLRSPLPKMKILQGVLWTGDASIVVGDSGTIAASNNGYSWAFRTTGTTSSVIAATMGGGKLVAVGAAGLVRTSTDGGATWTAKSSGVTATLRSIVWTGTRFIAAGTSGTIVTSPDGDTWTQQTSNATGTLYGVAWTGSLAVAVGDAGVLLTSPDGLTWTARTSGTTVGMYGLTWGGGQLVAVGNTGTVRTSPDGITWTTRTSNVTVYLNAVTWTGSLYAAVGDAGTVITSPDGVTWTARASGTTQVLRAVTWTATRLMAVGNAGVIRTSSDGITWGSPALISSGLNGVAWASGKPRVIAADGGSVVVSTTDTGWAVRSTGVTSGLYGVTWANNQVVAVGAGGTVVTSPDGDAWTTRTSGTTEVLNGVAWSPTLSQLVAVGANGSIRTSSDGTAWTARTSGVTTFIYSAAWCGSQFVAVGAGGVILTSTNAVTWTARTSGTTQPLRSVTYSGDQIVVVGNSGTILTSPDGVTWTARTSGTTKTLYSVAYNAGTLVATSTGLILTSTDAITWTPQSPGTDTLLYGATGVQGGWVVVGAVGTILTSPQLVLPDAPALASPADLATDVSVFGPLTWSASSGATYYRLQVATDSNFVGMVFNDTTSLLSRNLPALTSNTLHYWRVRAFNALGGGAYSARRSFTTGTAPSGPPPAPALVSPDLFASDVAIPVTLTWGAANGASSYHVQLSTTSNFASRLLDDSTVTATSRAFAGVTGGVTYYWRVRGKNGFGVSAWSDIWAFTTLLQPPSAPTLSLPASFATDVNRDATLSWTASSGALTYRFQVALDAGFTQVVAQDSTVTGTSFKLGVPLAASTAHFWRVNAKNAAGTSAWSAIRQFTTGTTVPVWSGAASARFVRYAGEGYLRYGLDKPERVVVRLHDMRGRLIAELVNASQSAGAHLLALPAGMGGSLYLLEIRTGEHREWVKIHP